MRAVEARLGRSESIDVGGAGGALAAWRNAFRLIQSSEAWGVHGAWIDAVKPAFGPGVRDRFATAARLDPAEVEAAQQLRMAVRRRMRDLLPPGTVLLAPSAPGIAPPRGAPPQELDAFRASALALLSPAGHAGLPQISLPLGTLEGCPLGLSLIAGPDEDRRLLDHACRLAT